MSFAVYMVYLLEVDCRSLLQEGFLLLGIEFEVLLEKMLLVVLRAYLL